MSTLKLFEWKPDLGASPQTASLARPVKFGDGYEARVATTLHPVVSSWTVTFSRPVTEILVIDKFLKEQAGISAFRWVNPLNEEATYVCRAWNGPMQVDKGLYQINATFEQVFES